MSRYHNSNEYLKRSQKVIPLGSQTFSKSHIQYPKDNAPLYISRGKGSHVWDIDGNEYIDLVNGLSPVVLGYCDPNVDAAICNQLNSGITFSMPSPLETELAEKLVEIIPCAEMVRFGKNGTDATSAAVRLARAYTGRERVIALGYHGWQDWYIGATSRSKGVPKSVQELTHKLPFNDLDAVKTVVDSYPDQIAAIILEPMNTIEPHYGYLEALRDLTLEKDIILIFDEVVTGFRFSLGGAQELFNVTPDLSAFGKAMGNGMPISAIVGKSEIMREMEEVFFSGTFGGESLSIAAAIAVIDKFQKEAVIEHIWSIGERLFNGIQELILKYGLNEVVSLAGRAPLVALNFKDCGVVSAAMIRTFFLKEMLARGVLTLGVHSISYALDEDDVCRIISSYNEVFSNLSKMISTNPTSLSLSIPIIQPIFSVRS